MLSLYFVNLSQVCHVTLQSVQFKATQGRSCDLLWRCQCKLCVVWVLTHRLKIISLGQKQYLEEKDQHLLERDSGHTLIVFCEGSWWWVHIFHLNIPSLLCILEAPGREKENRNYHQRKKIQTLPPPPNHRLMSAFCAGMGLTEDWQTRGLHQAPIWSGNASTVRCSC